MSSHRQKQNNCCIIQGEKILAYIMDSASLNYSTLDRVISVNVTLTRDEQEAILSVSTVANLGRGKFALQALAKHRNAVAANILLAPIQMNGDPEYFATPMNPSMIDVARQLLDILRGESFDIKVPWSSPQPGRPFIVMYVRIAEQSVFQPLATRQIPSSFDMTRPKQTPDARHASAMLHQLFMSTNMLTSKELCEIELRKHHLRTLVKDGTEQAPASDAQEAVVLAIRNGRHVIAIGPMCSGKSVAIKHACDSKENNKDPRDIWSICKRQSEEMAHEFVDSLEHSWYSFKSSKGERLKASCIAFMWSGTVRDICYLMRSDFWKHHNKEMQLIAHVTHDDGEFALPSDIRSQAKINNVEVVSMSPVPQWDFVRFKDDI